MAVDTAEGVISHVQADFADGRDSQCLPDITRKLQQRLASNELCLEELLADTGYSNGTNYALLEQWRITGWIPVFGQYKAQIEGFPIILKKTTLPARKVNVYRLRHMTETRMEAG